MLQAPTLLLISFLISTNTQAAALVSKPYPPPYVVNGVDYIQPTHCIFTEVDSKAKPVVDGLVVETPVQSLDDGSVRCYWPMTDLPEMSKRFSVKAVNVDIKSKNTFVFLTRHFEDVKNMFFHFTQNPTWSNQ